MFPPLRQISPQFALGRRAGLNFLTASSPLLVCALFLLVGLATAGDYGLGLDELDQRHTAQANLNYILGQADRVDRNLFHDHDRVYGVAFELPLLLAEQALGLTDYHEVHRLRLILTHLFFIVGAFFCYRLAYHLFGSRAIALFALLFFLLHPRIYAHSFINSKDLPFLSMFVLALYLLERAFRRDSIGAFVLLGLAAGLLTNLRIMGVMLPVAALALRGLDWFYAGSGRERKHILLTGGAFMLAAGLTWYAASPYAWSNPVDYWRTSLGLTVNHPTVLWTLFQGQTLRSNELPPHYTITWFSIATPPLILLLGLRGMAAVMARGYRRPGAVFRNTRLRLQWLLLAAFLLPPLAAALLGSNQYGGWRHFYFLYAPFCLLAAGGLGGLVSTLAHWRAGRAGVYALTAAGLGLLPLQIAQLYPLQYSYFNFLVNRAAPEYLRTQYEMDYWQLAYREGLEYLLERHPGETLTVRGEGKELVARYRKILPAGSRQRLRIAAAGGRADYELLHTIAPSQPDLAFNSAYRHPIYNSALIAVRPLAAARMTPAAAAAYQEIYRQATAGEPIIRADYNVYRNGNRLLFVRENCPPEEPDAWLGGKLFPPNPETLPLAAQSVRSYATFGNHRVRLGPLCLAVVQLPDYARGDLIVMQRNLGPFGPVGAPLWERLYSLSRPGLKELLADYRRNRERPAGPEGWVVFIDRAEGRNRLLYAKANCSQAEYEPRVTLHITPVNRIDLPAAHRGNGFENRDFPLDYYGGRPEGACVAVVSLPEYPIAAIRTGQEGVWERNLYLPADSDTLRAAYAALSDIQPEVRAAFDLYRRDNQLIYLRKTCTAADTAAGFFLHILPEEVAALPAERQAAGFANMDFAFVRWGGFFDDKCLASVPLPDYAIKSIRTGQFQTGQGELWAAELTAGR